VTYDGRHLYDFCTALSRALERAYAQLEKRKAMLTAEQRHWRTHFPSPPTADELRRHAAQHGPDEVNEIAAAYGIELEALAEGKPTAHQLRIKQALRLHQEGVATKEIAARMEVSVETVRKYLSAPSTKHATKPSETPSTGQTAGSPTSTLPPRQEALKERVRALRDEGLVRTAIADRLGKTDATVGKYLKILRLEEAA